jgi:hypothetical protein
MASIEKPTLLIITGPQGSGNHLFSKVFSSHKDVVGWKALYNELWIGHYREPFQSYWKNPVLLKEFDWTQSNYYMTSISCPYVDNDTKAFTIPHYKDFIKIANNYANIIIGIIGRDKNILKHQQHRVRRGEYTTPTALKEITKLKNLSNNIFYLSQELLFLYGKDYLSNLSKQMNFPIALEEQYIADLLKTEANYKYIKAASEQGPFDEIQGKINYID